MKEATSHAETFAVTCPHCKKPFAALLLGDGRTTGFKCPHCRLFVPLGRADDAPLARDPDA